MRYGMFYNRFKNKMRFWQNLFATWVNRKAKEKAPAPPTLDIDGDGPTRGQKRAAAGDQSEVVDESSEPTPRKPMRSPTFNVVINSPPLNRPKQRIRTNEAGDAADIPDTSESVLDRQLWVGTGKV